MTPTQAHEWKRARSHVAGLRMVADALASGKMTPERAVEVLREYTTWLDRDLEDLHEQANTRENEQFDKGVSYSEWLASMGVQS